MNHEFLWISKMPGSGFGIQYIGDRIKEFSETVRFVTKMNFTFEQGTGRDWKYFEFFTKDQDWILEVCLEVSKRMRLDLMNREPSRQDLGLE